MSFAVFWHIINTKEKTKMEIYYFKTYMYNIDLSNLPISWFTNIEKTAFEHIYLRNPNIVKS